MLNRAKKVIDQFKRLRFNLEPQYDHILQNLLCFAIKNNLYFTVKILIEVEPSLLSKQDSNGQHPIEYVSDQTDTMIKACLSQCQQTTSDVQTVASPWTG